MNSRIVMLPEDRCRRCVTALLLVLFGMLRVPTCCGSRQSFLAESKTIIGFRFRGELARNEKMPVGESRLPQSLHHLVFGCDGLLYASSFISRCVCVCVCVLSCICTRMDVDMQEEKGTWIGPP